MSTMMRSVGLPLPDDVRERWRELEEAAEHPSVFRTPEWVEARAHALGLEAKSRVHLWSDADRLVGVLPITATRERLHPSVPLSVRLLAVTGAGVGAGDHTGWTATEAGHGHIAAWLAATRRTILLRNLDPQFVGHVGGIGVPVAQERCPRLDLKGQDARSKSFAKRVAYYRRRVEREGCKLSRTMPGEVTDEHLNNLRKLHEQRFGSATVLTGESIVLQEELLRRQRPDLGPVVITASVAGAPVGILWGLWFAGVFAYYQSGWLPGYRSANLGTVLVDEAIATARDMGASTFDFLRGPEEYKYRFGADDRTDMSILIPRGLPGMLLRLKALGKAALRT